MDCPNCAGPKTANRPLAGRFCVAMRSLGQVPDGGGNTARKWQCPNCGSIHYEGFQSPPGHRLDKLWWRTAVNKTKS